MNTPSPIVPEPPRRLNGREVHVAAAAALGGSPLSILSVMLWEAHTGITLDSVRAAAVGSVGAGLFAYLWHVITTLIDRHILS